MEKERKKAEKQAKFDQKKQKTATAATAESSKNKEKKAKAEKKAEEELLPPYVEDTPAGEKKSSYLPLHRKFIWRANLLVSNKILRRPPVQGLQPNRC